MRIGELAAATGVSAKTLRFYEAQGLLPAPPRTVGGYRDYSSAAVDRVAFVRGAQAAGLTLAQIGQVLEIRDGGQPPCDHVAALVRERLGEVDTRLAELMATREALTDLQQRVEALDPAECAPDWACAAIQPA